jgi:hypothetical protein
MSAMPALSISSSLNPSDATSVNRRPRCSTRTSYSCPTKCRGQLFFVGFLGVDGLPRRAEVVDEVGERQHQSFLEQAGLRSEMAEQEVFADPCGLGYLPRGGAAVVAAGEQIASGIEQKPARFAARPTARRPLLLGGTSLGHGLRLL